MCQGFLYRYSKVWFYYSLLRTIFLYLQYLPVQLQIRAIYTRRSKYRRYREREKKLGLLSANSLTQQRLKRRFLSVFVVVQLCSLTQQRLNRRFLAVFVVVQLCSPTTLLVLLWLISNKRSWLAMCRSFLQHISSKLKILHYFECQNKFLVKFF